MYIYKHLHILFKMRTNFHITWSQYGHTSVCVKLWNKYRTVAIITDKSNEMGIVLSGSLTSEPI